MPSPRISATVPSMPTPKLVADLANGPTRKQVKNSMRRWQVRSAVTPQVSGNGAAKVHTHAALVKFESGQLLFLGLSQIRH